ncbi:MAG: MBL fold metallo-hydrolase [Alphaproteobacteria bacterium HGW-Alphaproteobacteria-6]|nr:MAG: MBL fold metallo-hydrolase [Alphaproteobacteria bacterium HGW-Alphaproteobacteria-6]
MADFVALLGTKGGPAIRTGSTNPTSSLLSLAGQVVVVDCGLGVTRGLVDQGIALKDLDQIVITHLHSDHYLELGPLLHTAWVAGLKTPVTVRGPEGLTDYWRHFLAAMQADIAIRIADEGRPALDRLVDIRVVDPASPFRVGPLQVHAMPTDHPPVPCLAYRFEAEGKAVVFSGDTAHLPALAGFALGADLLVHEAMLAEALPALVARVGNGDGRLMAHLMRSHTLASDAARTATAAGVRALALHHLVPSDDPDYGEAEWRQSIAGHWDGPFHLGRDGLRIAI